MFSTKLARLVMVCRLKNSYLQLRVRRSNVASDYIDANDHQICTEEGPSHYGRSVESQSDVAPNEIRKSGRRRKARGIRSKENVVNSDGDLFDGELRRLTDVELVQKVSMEELEWFKRINDTVNPSFISEEKDSLSTPSACMEMTPEEKALKRRTGKTVFRSIIYSEGELDGSDLDTPPSSANPHPFIPSKHSPPVYARSLVPFVNYSFLLQTLVDIGVNLFEVEQNTRAGKQLLRLDLEKDVGPKLRWLLSLGFQVGDLGVYLTKNPFYLLQDLNDMQARVNYLTSMKFSMEDVCGIIRGFRYWLNVDVKILDSRLGWVQRQFDLSGNEVRALIRKEPRILMFGLGPLQRLVGLLNKELEFSPKQLKRILLSDPRVFMMDAKFIKTNYDYVHRIMRLSNPTIVRHPLILRCSHSSIRNRKSKFITCSSYRWVLNICHSNDKKLSGTSKCNRSAFCVHLVGNH
ncbi:hypothetical protein KIN20_019049 [Parelaphostrongylus tenuis]|uniref:Transcription termination factor 3, mitochondrial n=1 Tax=Parelaphostrongylus tenuis TaxID=148309 RepID=A0AAD5MQX4_PARTN|nr:hypothetical protein KIN20_019049 [Parelaphostrongylus tenuis]